MTCGNVFGTGFAVVVAPVPVSWAWTVHESANPAAAATTDVALKWTSKFNDNKTELEAVLGWHRASFKGDSIDEAANGIPRQDLVFGNLGTWAMLGHESSATRAGCTDATDPAVDPYIFIENCPMGRQGDPELDIGPIAWFLCSDACRYLTGHTFMADGGAFMWA